MLHSYPVEGKTFHIGNEKDKKNEGNMAFKDENLINTIELGRAIKRRREELGLSLRDVADKTNVSASTLSRIENGIRQLFREH